VNRTIARAERRLNSALAKQPTPATGAEPTVAETPAQQPPPLATEAESSPHEAPDPQPQPPDEVEG